MRTNPLQTFTGVPQPEAEPASPYLRFSRPGWAALRADAPLTLDEDDLERLRGINVALSMQEVEEIYLPLARLLNLYVAASQDLYRATATFLGHRSAPVPYIIGLAGSVAVGKSTTARILQALLTRWPDHRKVDLVTTDGFLLPNRVLERRGLMRRKGFPESYDLPRMIQFVTELKAGRTPLHIPVYSHHEYDIVPDRFQVIDQPDILIVEGLNVLQTGTLPRGSGPRIFVSDFFDFSVYVHAETRLIEDWYVSRFMTFRERAKGDASSFFHRFADLSDEEARHYAKAIWRDINETNLRENILPSKDRARLILGKGEDHAVDTVWLRKL